MAGAHRWSALSKSLCGHSTRTQRVSWTHEPRMKSAGRILLLPRCQAALVIGAYQQDYRRSALPRLTPLPPSITGAHRITRSAPDHENATLDTSPVISTIKFRRVRPDSPYLRNNAWPHVACNVWFGGEDWLWDALSKSLFAFLQDSVPKD